MERMTAFRLYKDGRRGIEEVPVPIINDDEVLVRVRGAAICHSDIDFIDGQREVISYTDSLILGHEYAGEVAKVGNSVAGFKPGDKVVCESIIWCGKCKNCRQGQTPICTENGRAEHGCVNHDGGFAQYVVSRPDMLVPFCKISFEEASCVEPAGNASHIIDYANICEEDIVVVIGPGAIGLYAVALAKLHNPKMVIMVGTRKSRLDKALEMGADHVVNIRECDAKQEIMKITGGKKCDVVIQCATTQSAVDLGMDIIEIGGKFLLEGFTREEVPFCWDEFIYKGITVVGVAGARHKDYQQVVRYAEEGKLNLSIPITTVLPLTDIEEGFRRVKDKSTDTIKVVLNP